MNETLGAAAIAVGLVLVSSGWAVSDYLLEPIDVGKCGKSPQAMELCQEIIAAGLDRGDIDDLTGLYAEERLADFANLHLSWSDVAEDGGVSVFDPRSQELKVLINHASRDGFVASMPATTGDIPAGAKFEGSIEYGDVFERDFGHGLALFQDVNVCAHHLQIDGKQVMRSKSGECLLYGEYTAPFGGLSLGLRAEWYVAPEVATALNSNSKSKEG